MGANSAIEWTESTWNPVTGCTKISLGCLNCYAERMASRLKAMGQANYAKGFAVTVHPRMLDTPLTWKRPQMIFVNSMSDLFHEAISLEFIQKVFDVMRQAHWHTFQILTKRSVRLLELAKEIDWPENVWMGATVESKDWLCRIDDLRATGAHVKFLSLEPLLGPLPDLNLDGIDWIVVGGESGPGARVMNAEWVKQILSQCLKQHVPFFFKQWGGVNKKKAGRSLEGKVWNEMPVLGGRRIRRNVG